MTAMTNLANTMQVSAAATSQAMERMGRPTENENGEGKGTGNNLGGVFMTLAAFLKVDIPWVLFQTDFYKKFFLESVREAKELELMQLKQGFMSIADYTSKFEELCRFSRVCQGVPESHEG
ncbi:hypothetical protein AHAS_Ahas13G0317000 [Arachis hypogaea]